MNAYEQMFFKSTSSIGSQNHNSSPSLPQQPTKFKQGIVANDKNNQMVDFGSMGGHGQYQSNK